MMTIILNLAIGGQENCRGRVHARIRAIYNVVTLHNSANEAGARMIR